MGCVRTFCYEHSLSLALGVGFIVCTWLSWICKHGDDWWSNFWMSTGGGFGGGVVIVLLARLFWEKDSDPTQPPPN